jgi:acetyl-CoA carboxylase carboxyl transferase subunit alpha
MSASAGPLRTYLDFERPLAALDAAIAGTRGGTKAARLRAERRRVVQALHARLTPWQRVQLSRHPDRPTMRDYAAALFPDLVELHGDRLGGDDATVVGGVARFRGRAVVVIGQQQQRGAGGGDDPRAGMPGPEGYRKAIRLFALAERFRRPVVTLVDTPGAYPGAEAEAGGQAEAIASALQVLATVAVPVVSAVIGEGGSGGALALAAADRVLMLEHAWYSVISPEGCAAILFRESGPDAVARSAALLGLTAADVARAGVVDEIVREPGGGAHREPARAAACLARVLARHLAALADVPPARLVARRRARYRRTGTDLPPV